MTTLANRKFSKVIDKYLETGTVTVDFNKATLATTLNGEDFTPVESQQLVEDFGKHPVFKSIMEIVNASPVASEARSHVNSVKSLQDALAGYGDVEEDEDIDFQEDIDDLVDDEDDEDGEWVQVDVEEFLEVIGKDTAQEIFKAIEQAGDVIEDLDDENEIVIEIPGVGKAVLSKVGEFELDEEEEVKSPKETLSAILAELVEEVAGAGELDDPEFIIAKNSLDSLPKDVKKLIKMTALSSLGEVLIENAKAVDLPEDELKEIIEIIVKMIGETDRISGDNLPEPSDFITAMGNVLEQYL